MNFFYWILKSLSLLSFWENIYWVVLYYRGVGLLIIFWDCYCFDWYLWLLVVGNLWNCVCFVCLLNLMVYLKVKFYWMFWDGFFFCVIIMFCFNLFLRIFCILGLFFKKFFIFLINFVCFMFLVRIMIDCRLCVRLIVNFFWLFFKFNGVFMVVR